MYLEGKAVNESSLYHHHFPELHTLIYKGEKIKRVIDWATKQHKVD